MLEYQVGNDQCQQEGEEERKECEDSVAEDAPPCRRNDVDGQFSCTVRSLVRKEMLLEVAFNAGDEGIPVLENVEDGCIPADEDVP